MKNIRNFNYEKATINISNKKAYLIMLIVFINTVLILILFMMDLFNNISELAEIPNSTKEHQALVWMNSKLIIIFLISCLMNIIFILYIHLSIRRIKIGYVFAIAWFLIWGLFTIGVFFVYDGLLPIKIINIILGSSLTVLMLMLIFDLQNKRRLIDFEKRKKNSVL